MNVDQRPAASSPGPERRGSVPAWICFTPSNFSAATSWTTSKARKTGARKAARGGSVMRLKLVSRRAGGNS